MWQRYNGTTKIFEVSTDDGGSWLPLDLDAAIITQGTLATARIPNLDASKITSGALAKAQQHAQTAYKDTANVFAAAANEFQEILLVDKGLRFPAAQVASAGANDLDDYEEGTWTPAYNVGGSVVGVTYTTQVGAYTKKGNEVTAYGRITLSNKGAGAGTISITGLPFAGANNEVGSFDPAGNYSGTFTGTLSIVLAGSTLFVVQSSTGTRVQPVNADFTNTSDMRFNITYFV
jgi:hypothetical protein